jgi:hypothetical protein
MLYSLYGISMGEKDDAVGYLQRVVGTGRCLLLLQGCFYVHQQVIGRCEAVVEAGRSGRAAW